MPKRSLVGRPEVTSHAAIERAAFELFAERGFDATTLDAIAAAVGVSRRTLFRYFGSKNDIPWGQFDDSLSQLRESLDAAPTDIPMADAIHACVIAFNDFAPEAIEQHRFRMVLILGTPTLRAHSMLRYRAWRRVISDYAAARLNVSPGALVPNLIGHVSLALALNAYEQWLARPGSSLTEILDESMGELRNYLNR